MKLSNTALLFVLCIVSFNLCVFAQETIPKPASSESEFTILVKNIYKKNGITSVVSLEQLFIKSPDNQTEQLSFDSVYGYDEKSTFVTRGNISFYSNAQECQFGETDITFVVDGEPIRINYRTRRKRRGEAVATSAPFFGLINGKCKETYDVILPRKDYLKIIRAKRSIEVQTDKLKFKFSASQLRALNELARRMPR